MPEFLMPSLGADMVDATLIEWKVKAGDPVKRGDIIAEIETDKGDIDVEVYEDGVVEKIVAQPGEKLPVGSLLAVISERGAPLEKPVAKENGSNVPKYREKDPLATLERPEREQRERIKASPLARRMAKELGIDLHGIQGSGPWGAIKRADVEAAAKAQATAPYVQAEKVKPGVAREAPESKSGQLTFAEKMRQAIANAMARSNREIPHYYLETDVDMSKAIVWLEAENKKRSVKERLLPAVLHLKAVAMALAEVPELNAYWLEDRHQPQEAINIGFAISLRKGGLLTPAISNVDLKSLDQLMEELVDVTQRARLGKLRSSELTDGTLTLTSLGERGVEKVFGVIYPPQVALVGLGKITERPWAENGTLSVRPVMTVTLAGDHRATDGRTGAKFLEILKRYLQSPEEVCKVRD